MITPGYFEMFATGAARGRLFTRADSAGSQPVALVNERFVRLHFPDKDPIGQAVRLGDDPAGRGARSSASCLTCTWAARSRTAATIRTTKASIVPLAQNRSIS